MQKNKVSAKVDLGGVILQTFRNYLTSFDDSLKYIHVRILLTLFEEEIVYTVQYYTT